MQIPYNARCQLIATKPDGCLHLYRINATLQVQLRFLDLHLTGTGDQGYI